MADNRCPGMNPYTGKVGAIRDERPQPRFPVFDSKQAEIVKLYTDLAAAAERESNLRRELEEARDAALSNADEIVELRDVMVRVYLRGWKHGRRNEKALPEVTIREVLGGGAS